MLYLDKLITRKKMENTPSDKTSQDEEPPYKRGNQKPKIILDPKTGKERPVNFADLMAPWLRDKPIPPGQKADG